MSRFEKAFYIFLISLAVFTFGVQVGIHHGRNLERADCEQRLEGELCSTVTPFNASNQEKELFQNYDY